MARISGMSLAKASYKGVFSETFVVNFVATFVDFRTSETVAMLAATKVGAGNWLDHP